MSFLTLVLLAQSFNLNAQYGTEAKPLVVRQNDNAVSSFGSLRVSAPYAEADLTNTYGMDTNESYGTRGDGGLTSLLNESAGLISGGSMEVRTHDNYRYQAGRGQQIYQTVSIPTAADAGTYRWGYFDDNDGIFWEYTYEGLKLVTRSSTDGGITDTKVSIDAGASWNPLYSSIYEIRFQWLGSGKTRAYINSTQVAEINNFNRWTGPFMKTAYLPLSWSVLGTSAQLKAICSSVSSEGGQHPAATPFAVVRTADLTISGSAGLTPVVSIRPAAFFKTVRSRIQLQPTSVWCTSDSKRINVSIILNPTTLTGALYSAVNAFSATEVSTAATAFAGGYVVATFGVPANGFTEQKMEHVFGENLRKLRQRAFSTNDAGTAFFSDLDTLVVAAENPAAGNATVRCGIEFEEER